MTCVSCEPKSRTAMVCAIRDKEPLKTANQPKKPGGAHGIVLKQVMSRRPHSADTDFCLEFQPRVFMAAARTFAGPSSSRRGVKMVATDAVKGRFSALALEARVVAAVIVKPKTEEHRCDEQAVDHERGGQSEHGRNLRPAPAGRPQPRRIFPAVKTKTRRGSARFEKL